MSSLFYATAVRPLQCSAVFPITFWGMLLIFGTRREAGQANGRWQAVFIFHQEHGGRERGEGAELSANKCDLAECEQKSFGTWRRMQGWAGTAEPVYIPSCWEHAPGKQG